MTSEQILFDLIKRYCEDYAVLRENNLDLSNVAFHRRYGLFLQVPASWALLEIAVSVLKSSEKPNNMVVFSSSSSYRYLYDTLPQDDTMQFLSWHEIFSAMHTASTDARYVQKIKLMLSSADLVLFVDPPSITEVLDQVRGFVSGCLVVLSKGINGD